MKPLWREKRYVVNCVRCRVCGEPFAPLGMPNDMCAWCALVQLLADEQEKTP